MPKELFVYCTRTEKKSVFRGKASHYMFCLRCRQFVVLSCGRHEFLSTACGPSDCPHSVVGVWELWSISVCSITPADIVCLDILTFHLYFSVCTCGSHTYWFIILFSAVGFYLCLFVYRYVCLSIVMSVCLSICLSLFLSVYCYVCLSILKFNIHLSVLLFPLLQFSICLSVVHLFVHSVYLSIVLSVLFLLSVIDDCGNELRVLHPALFFFYHFGPEGGTACKHFSLQMCNLWRRPEGRELKSCLDCIYLLHTGQSAPWSQSEIYSSVLTGALRLKGCLACRTDVYSSWG